MLSVDELEPMVQAARRVYDQCARDPDKQLREMAEKAFCDTFTARNHALLCERKMAEAEMTRSYAFQLSTQPGMQRMAEYERLRADTLYQQALKHQAASEKCQLEGDQEEVEVLTMLKGKAQPQAAPARGGGSPPPQMHRRHREHPAPPPPPEPVGFVEGGEGDGDGQ